jgi:tetratricopeptide (TPR) repeat protein
MKLYDESIVCCNKILEDYPRNIDVLFDKSCNFAMLSKLDEALDILENIIMQKPEYKIKAKKNKSFENLANNLKFQKLIS